jgi:hypothetical protein
VTAALPGLLVQAIVTYSSRESLGDSVNTHGEHVC